MGPRQSVAADVRRRIVKMDRFIRLLTSAATHLPASVLILLVPLGICPQVGWAQPVTYVGLDPATGLGQLRLINSDGTGDRLIPLNFPEPGFPSFSKDGRFLAFTSHDPGRPNKQSEN